MSGIKPLIVSLAVIGCFAAGAAESSENIWQNVCGGQTGIRRGSGLIWSGKLKRFVLFSGARTFAKTVPYDVLSLELTGKQWFNDLPAGGQKWGPKTGNVTAARFASGYFCFKDREGITRPQSFQAVIWNQYALAPWDGKVYMLMAGRTLCYDPVARIWSELAVKAGPVPAGRSFRTALAWGAFCADPVNRQIVLFGGQVDCKRQGPGTWVFSTEKKTWTDLKLEVQPPVRAQSPMTFDPVSKKILLFGGTRLDMNYADTWVYDCASRKWKEIKPALSPSPRFGHALITLPVSKKVVLLGGNRLTNSTGYMGKMSKPLPFETWTYDLIANKWSQLSNSGAPLQGGNLPLVAAVNDQDQVLICSPNIRYKKNSDLTWVSKINASKVDAAATAKNGVKPGTVAFRKGGYDPKFFIEGLPTADTRAVEAFYKGLKPNVWTDIKCPKWPPRTSGGWSTVSLDTNLDQLLHISGGHSAYYGNDVAHLDLKTLRWTISYPPQFALDFNYAVTGPGRFAFNGGPWGAHNYKAYTYSKELKRMLVSTDFTSFYNPVKRTWLWDEHFKAKAFKPSKYTTLLAPCKDGVYAWALSGRPGIFKLAADGKKWEVFKTSGDKLPRPVTDGSGIAYDSKRNSLMLMTSGGYNKTSQGRVWSVDLGSGVVKNLNPAGWEKLTFKRTVPRELICDPQADLMVCGFLIERDGKLVLPILDLAANAWFTADMPGSGFCNLRGKKPGRAVTFGMSWDPKRKLIWGVDCILKSGYVKVLKLDRKTLNLKAFAGEKSR
jgi:Galactose oxidase, central domain